MSCDRNKLSSSSSLDRLRPFCSGGRNRSRHVSLLAANHDNFGSTREASMSGRVKLLACLAGAVAPWLLMTGIASAADENFTVKKIISLPNGQSVGSFDIAFDDANIHTLAFADRTNKSVDLIDTNTNTVVKQLTANPPFAGVRPNPGAASGPDGVLIVDQKEIWVG